MAVDPVPARLHSITPHLVCTPCTEAIAWYEKAFGACEYGPRMTGPDGAIGHAELQVGDSVFMLADEWPDAGPRSPATLGGTTTTMFVYVDDVDELWERAVAAGAEVVYPLEDQFYGDRSGRIRDPFGHHWGLGQHVEDVSEEEMDRRMSNFYDEQQS